MRCAAWIKLATLMPAIYLASAGASCDNTQGLLDDALFGGGPAGNPLPFVPSDSVLLLLDNQSGEFVTVDAEFQAQNESVRRTTRLLRPSGVEATADILRTVADRIVVVAAIAADPNPTAKMPPGYVLAEQEFRLGVDYQGGDTINFVITAPPADCNDNQTPDSEELQAGSAQDCNANGRPDECDVADGTSADLDGGGIPDECEDFALQITGCPDGLELPADQSCAGSLPDLRSHATVSGSAVVLIGLTITQNPPAGTPLIMGVPISASIIAANDHGETAACSVGVMLFDATAPEISADQGITLDCGESLDPDEIGGAYATDNCDTEPLLEYADSFAGVCPITLTRTWTATDQSGNTSSLDQIITIIDDTPPEILCWPRYLVLYADQYDQAAVPDISQDLYVRAEDDCDEALTIIQDPAPGTIVGLGHFMLTLTAVDDCGNAGEPRCVRVRVVCECDD